MFDQKKKIYLIVGLIMIILLTFLGILSYSTQNSRNIKTDQTPAPTRFESTPKREPSITLLPTLAKEDLPQRKKNYNFSFLRYRYPIRYNDLIIDMSKDKSKMLVYYKSKESQARKEIKKFFQQYGFSDPIETNIAIFFIGLNKEKTEPPAGFFRD